MKTIEICPVTTRVALLTATSVEPTNSGSSDLGDNAFYNTS